MGNFDYITREELDTLATQFVKQIIELSNEVVQLEEANNTLIKRNGTLDRYNDE